MNFLLAVAFATAIVLAISLVIGVVSYIYSLVEINQKIATQIDLQNQYDVERYNHNIRVFSRGSTPPKGTPPTPPRPPTSGPSKLSPDGKVVVLRRPAAPPKGPDKR